MSSAASDFNPSTDECPRHRILVVGKSGAGKSSLINAVFGVENATAVSHNTPGVHDIDKPITYSTNDRIIIHDSQGFEPGEATNFQKVTEFIDRRCSAFSPTERLHGIWVCAEVPISGARLFETGVESILKKYSEDVFIIVVFTKVDLLYLHVENKVEEQFDELDDDQFAAKVEEIVQQEIQSRCVKQLSALTPENPSRFPWAVTSTDKDPKFQQSIRKLVDQALSSTRQESAWIGLAIAQRVYAQASIQASVRVGRKRYWRGLFSDIFVGVGMKNLIDVLHRDIITVWNMEDPGKNLLKPELLPRVSVLAEDLFDELKYDHLLVVRGIYKKVKNPLLFMIVYIIDLTLTMDTLFYLTLSRGQGSRSVTVKLINKALQMYKGRKGPIHARIRTWSDSWGALSLMDPDSIINKLQEILFEHSINPENWATNKVDMDDAWISVDSLRGS